MDTQELLNRIEALEKWKEERTRQQIFYPLDFQSQTILNKYFLSVIGTITNISVGGQEFNNLLIRQDNKINAISAFSVLITFTANSTTNILTLGANLITGTQGQLDDNSFVTVFSPSGTPPDPLESGFGYYVINSTGTTIQLSDTKGGSPIDLTTTGTGIQYLAII